MGSIHRRLAGAGAIAIALTAVAVTPAYAQTGEIKGANAKTAVADSYIVVLKDNAEVAATESLAAKANAKVQYRYTKAIKGFAATMSADDAKKLTTEPTVAYVEQNQKVKASNNVQTPTPSWGLDRIDQRAKAGTNAYGYRGNGNNVHAYVIDTGIEISHGEFNGRATWDLNTIDSTNTDCQGHGTHVAGTIGGSGVGVAKAVRLHAVKVLNCDGEGTWASVIAGVDWVTANAVKPAVANMSLGGWAADSVDAAVKKSIASGITYTVASVNDQSDACGYSPARVPEALTVNASDANDQIAGFSNYGSCTDLFAPGVGIYSSFKGNSYRAIDGTSMAAPHVAGVAALYLLANPAATPAQVSENILNTATSNAIANPKGSPNKLLYVNGEPDLVAKPDRLLQGQGLELDQRITSPNGQNVLIMQNDHNLVLYNGTTPKFATATNNAGAVWAVLQSDGNFVVYTTDGKAVWNTETWGSGATRLVVQDDGKAVLLGESYKKIWVSHS